jgi:hypothetical protein
MFPRNVGYYKSRTALTSQKTVFFTGNMNLNSGSALLWSSELTTDRDTLRNDFRALIALFSGEWVPGTHYIWFSVWTESIRAAYRCEKSCRGGKQTLVHQQLSKRLTEFQTWDLRLRRRINKQTKNSDRATAEAGEVLRVVAFALSAQRILTAVNFGLLDQSRYFFFHVVSQLSSGKSGGSVNRTRDFRICEEDLWPLDHSGGPNC